MEICSSRMGMAKRDSRFGTNATPTSRPTTAPRAAVREAPASVSELALLERQAAPVHIIGRRTIPRVNFSCLDAGSPEEVGQQAAPAQADEAERIQDKHRPPSPPMRAPPDGHAWSAGRAVRLAGTTGDLVELHPAMQPCSDVPETPLTGWEALSRPSSLETRAASPSRPGHAGTAQQAAARTRPQSAAVRRRPASTTGIRPSAMRPTSAGPATPGGERPASALGAPTAENAGDVRPASAQGWVGGGARLSMMPEMKRRPGTPEHLLSF
ncbi:hypothetical protein T484DRAFT_1909480 [Baffinella frigidus]|nr:hypothetical protein T484DRAFT_1909480 [Cryptophyta sp. CCMP2293]